ncbi:hypothetical protein O9X98_14275 [Agrobacterium salinitolerans]|nr:hypothetical protein [Agrobacterium salinitolerans]
MTTHHIVPGSVEMDGTTVTAAVHTGQNEWTPQNLRYVRADISTGAKTDSVLSFLAGVYDNSEGCLVKGDFKMKQA